MEDTKKLMTEELNKMKGLMGFKAGMTKTELKDKLMAQLAEEAFDDIKEPNVGEMEVKEDGVVNDISEEDKDEKDEKDEELDETSDGFKEEKLQAQGQQSEEDDHAMTPKEDMFEKPEVKPGGFKMSQGFVNESALSNKETKLKNKRDRLNKKLGISL